MQINMFCKYYNKKSARITAVMKKTILCLTFCSLFSAAQAKGLSEVFGNEPASTEIDANDPQINSDLYNNLFDYEEENYNVNDEVYDFSQLSETLAQDTE
jgi:hypothetical protein